MNETMTTTTNPAATRLRDSTSSALTLDNYRSELPEVATALASLVLPHGEIAASLEDVDFSDRHFAWRFDLDRLCRLPWVRPDFSRCMGDRLTLPIHSTELRLDDATLPILEGRARIVNELRATKAVLRQAQLARSTVRYATFTGADLTGSCFYGTDLTGAVFDGATLDGCDFTLANVHGVNFTKAKMDSSTKLPSPTAMLAALWGRIESPELRFKLMMFDALSHPAGVAVFDCWAHTGTDGDGEPWEDSPHAGLCPYETDSCNWSRAVSFHECADTWKQFRESSEASGLASPARLVAELILAKCRLPVDVTTIDDVLEMFWNREAMRTWIVTERRSSTITEEASARVEAMNAEDAEQMVRDGVYEVDDWNEVDRDLDDVEYEVEED